MQKNFVETIAGLIVLAVAVLFVWKAYDKGIIEGEISDGYTVSATFDSIDGIEIGADVRISGVKIGKVIDIVLNNSTYTAQIKMKIFSNVKLPADSSAEILMMGLMGGKYIALLAGTEDVILKDGDVIEFTQSPVNLENLIGKFIFGTAEKNEKKSDKLEDVDQENPNASEEREGDRYNNTTLHHPSSGHIAYYSRIEMELSV